MFFSFFIKKKLLNVPLRHQKQRHRHQLPTLTLQKYVHSDWHISNRKLIRLNLRSSKYRDAVVEKLNRHLGLRIAL